MSLLAVLAILSVSGVLGKSSYSQKSGDGDVISQNLTAVWEAIHDLEHKVHHLQEHPKTNGHGHPMLGGPGDPDHPHHGGHGSHHGQKGGHGGHHGGYGQRQGGYHKEGDHHQLMSLLHEVGVKHTGGYYMSPVINSTTEVKPEGGIKLRPAFGTAYILYLKEHFTGSRFSNYAHDLICTYNAGGSIAFHLIHPDGTHERKVLGDVEKDHHEKYVVIIPGGTWEASELIEGDFALITFVSAPALDYSLFLPYDVENLVGEFPKYESMIRRLDTIAANDVQLNISDSSHDHQGHQGHDHHDQNHDEHHGSHHGIIGGNDGHDNHHGIIGGNDGHDHHQHHDHDDSHEEDDDSHEHDHP